MGMPLGSDERYFRSHIDESAASSIPHDKLQGGSSSSQLDFPETNKIIILSRKRNRLITNEKELASLLSRSFGLEAVIVSNEEHTFEQQVAYLRSARVVLGMHGSLLALTMFCRRGTVFLEMFPYAVPSSDYLPFKTMAQLPGMDLVYRAWENKDESASKSFPDRKKHFGGLMHLPEAERSSIMQSKMVKPHLCCSDPTWLYRIYQDTLVNVEEIQKLIHEGLEESRTRVLSPIAEGSYNPDSTELLPPQVQGISCLSSKDRPAGALWIQWDAPWNGAAVEKYSIQISSTGREYVSRHTSASIDGFTPGETVVFLIRPVKESFKGEFSKVGRCVV